MSSVENTPDKPDKINLPYDIFAITSFICTGFYVYLYSIFINQNSFPLHSFPERIIGVAVLEGVDTVARTHLYLYSFVFTGILALVLLIFLEKGLDSIIPKSVYKKERFLLALVSLLGTANFFFGILTKNSVFLFNIYLTITLLCCTLTLLATKKYTEIKYPQRLSLFEDTPLLISLFLVPIPCLFAIKVISGIAFAFSFVTFAEYYLFYSLFLCVLTLICPDKFPRIFDNTFRNRVTTSILPVYIFPVSIPLTNELQYTLSQWIVISPRVLSIGVLFCLGLICLALFKIQECKGISIFDPQSVIDNFSFPTILAALSIYTNYVAGGNFGQVEAGGNIFEFGLTSAVVQQFFDFGKIPFVNIVSAHGFMDVYYEIFYSLLNGYQPIDCFLWFWITAILIMLAGYFFFRELTDGPIAFLLMIFLPLYGILTLNNFIILIAGLFFIRFWRDPQLKNYIILLIAIVFCFIWRAEAGVSAGLAFLLIAAVLYFKILKNSPTQIWKTYSGYIFVTAGISGICAGLYLALCLLTRTAPATAIQSVIQLYIVNDPVGTYAGLFTTYNAQVALEYAIFPLFGLGLVLIFIWIALTRKDYLTPSLILIAFIAIATLFLSQRGVQRHSLIEGFATYYFPLLACSVSLIWFRSRKILSIIFLILILGAGSFIAQYPLTPVQKDLTGNFFDFQTWEHHEPRIILQESDMDGLDHLTNYLNSTLQPNETYFDMSNLLLPYTLLRKDYVPEGVQNLEQAGEWYQNDTIQRLEQNKNQMPIVVTGGWQIDNVPNEMRTYRIAEYVYQNYRPIGHIDTFDIWLRDDLDSEKYVNSPLLVQDKSINRNFDLKQLPYIWGTYDTMNPVSNQPVQNVLFNGEMQVDSNTPAVFTNISPDLDKTSGNYILVNLKSSTAAEIQMRYGNSTGTPALMQFETLPSNEPQNYLIRVSAQWDWYSDQVSYVRLTSDVPVTLNKCEILKGD